MDPLDRPTARPGADEPEPSDYSALWIYVVGPLIGTIVAVALARVLHGPGGDGASRRAAQGDGS